MSQTRTKSRDREVTPAELNRKTLPGHYWAGGVTGLYLRISTAGVRSWTLRVTIAGRRRDIGLGPVRDVSLRAARRKARRYRELIRHGRDPVEKRRVALERRAELRRAAEERRARTVTFDEAVRRYLQDKGREFSNRKHADQWRSTLATYASPVIGDKPVSEINTQDVLAVVGPIWNAKTETAGRLRSRIERVLAWAQVHGLRSGDNPARWRGHLRDALPAPSSIAPAEPLPSLPVDDMPRFMAAVRAREGSDARALEWIALTGMRSDAALGARWDEIDRDAAVWTVPPARLKGDKNHPRRKPHRVPLSGDALAMLDRLPRFAGCPYLFPGQSNDKPVSDTSVRNVIRHNRKGSGIHAEDVAAGNAGFVDPHSGRVVVPHGLRSALKTWGRDCTGHDNDVIEYALAHGPDDALEKSYMRGDLFEKRRRLMDDWADYAAGRGTPDNVTSIDRARETTEERASLM